MKRSFLNSTFVSIFQYLLILILIFECNSIYSQLYGYHYIIRGCMIVVSLVLLSILILDKNFAKTNKISKYNLLFIIYLFLVSMLLLLNSSGFSSTIIIVLDFVLFMPLCLYYLSILEKNEIISLCKKYINIVFIISFISLFFYLLGPVLKIIKPLNVIKVVWGRPYTLMDNYYYLFFDSNQFIFWLTNSPIPRNMGMFGEAPMYAFIILLALIFNNLIFYKQTKIKLYKIFVLILTMFSTISVTGICLMFFILFYNFIIWFKDASIKIKKVILLLSLIIFIASLPLGINILSKKFDSSSANHRNMDLINGFNVFLEEPILGKGINHVRDFENNPEKGYGYSNIIIPILTDGGLILSIIYLMPIFIFVFYISKNIKYVFLILVYVGILFTTAVQYRILLLFFILILYNFTVDKIIKKNKCGR